MNLFLTWITSLKVRGRVLECWDMGRVVWEYLKRGILFDTQLVEAYRMLDAVATNITLFNMHYVCGFK